MLAIGIHNKTWAQYVLTEADKQYELFNYVKAIDLYEQAYKKKATLYAAERLGECYKKQNNYMQAERWYATATSLPGSASINLLYYAQALQGNSKYNEAKLKYEAYAESNKDITATQKRTWLLSCDSALKWMKEPSSYSVTNVRILNSSQSDWGAIRQGDQVIFISDRGIVNPGKQSPARPFLKFDGARKPDPNIYGWTGNHYLRLYTQSGTDSIKLFPFDAGTQYHIGSASFTGDGNEVYFTLTKIHNTAEYEKVKGFNARLATVNVELYSSKKDKDGTWGKPVAFKYNNVNQYSIGDPYITKDGKSLYFASNMPGGKGGTDLYLVHQTSAGDWGMPINLKEVNSEYNERSPSVDAENNLYFSSDGRIGMGGLDIFKATLVSGKIGEPRNMGYPINTPQDDFAFNFSGKDTGYLSSSRTDGLGEDDIYSFMEQKQLAFRLIGEVYDKKTNLPLSNALISLNQLNGGILKVQTGDDGRFKFNLEKASDYKLTGEKTDFRSEAASLTTRNMNSSKVLEQDLFLERIELNKAIRLENINYDFDKDNIRPDAAIELDKLVKIMNDNPTIWIELGSHTDSRGSDVYNQQLSQRRAKSAVQYIIDKGINKNRIEAKGYGERRLLNECTNGVKCTEAEHQLNRRTEFTIVKY
ncbi:cell envelope biogenesis protein OmpA [Pedobacter mendelii]|uniref:Cell envelope biogenesis protein OmpA n=2 Tax=Pedobacter mendelii TaxID=1908240 RepID=A0ABQ2BMG1_9SPHI|nr:cell envelope biogenesis protein OmpA [Pedobacter mendelii]